MKNDLKEVKKNQVIHKILHEFKNEILRDYTVEFEKLVE